jgi:Ca2+-transporting ATPase
MEKEVLWHGLSWQGAVEKIGSDYKEGLSSQEVSKRRKTFGENKLPEERLLSSWALILEQFKNPLIFVLLIAGIIVLLFSRFTDAIVIFFSVLLNTIVGYIQEFKASRALSKLKKAIKIEADVIRNGHEKIISFEEVVPGDVFVIKQGDKVPADGRIIESFDLKTNEMSLTGEWLPAPKHSKTIPGNTVLADRDNMVYMGTIAEEGKGKAVAVATGVNTEIGKISEMIKETKERKTPLQKKLSNFARIIALVILFLCILIFALGLLRGESFLEMFTVAVAVAVAAVPEGLPVAMTVILALKMQAILKKGGLVRRLVAAETLGSTSIICTDKTKTLTEGNMRVSDVLGIDELIGGSVGDQMQVLKIAALTSDAFIENPEATMEEWIVRGSPTGKAMLLASIEAGIDREQLQSSMKEITEMPFSSSNKYLAKVFEINNKEDVLYVAGAPEKLLEMSKFVESRNARMPLDSDIQNKIEKQLGAFAEKGLRVVAVGYKTIDNLKDLFSDLVFSGLIVLKDPLRKDAKAAMNVCKKSGIRPIMVTGDHKLTAKTIAREIGLDAGEENIIEGKELDKLSDEEFLERLPKIDVYARMEPRHKMRIVEAWQTKGEVVAMTGDGINDTPALKKADIGIALGSGSEITKEVSDLVLLNDSFNVILVAVEEGRAIIDNIRKVITYLFSSSFTELILVGLSVFSGLPLPVTAAQILWVNLVEDGLPDIALSFEPKEKDVMKRKPEKSHKSFLNYEMKVLIFVIGIVTDVMLLGIFWWFLNYSEYPIEHIRSIIFAALAIDSLCYVFSCKNLKKNIWHMNIFSNRFLVFAWFFGAILLLSAIYLPFLQVLLKTVPLDLFDWLWLAGFGIINVLLIEGTKWLFIVKNKT